MLRNLAVAAAVATATAWPVVTRRSLAAALPAMIQPFASRAAEVGSLAASYDRWADGYDALDGGVAAAALGLDKLRARAASLCSGRVLEMCVGTGLNLPLYDGARCDEIVGIDLSAGMLREASAASERLRPAVKVVLKQMDARRLELPDGSFDSVLDTFSLCTIDRPVCALAEMARVCKPNGKVVLLEHCRSSGPLGAYQDATAGAAAALGGKGCVYNQDVRTLAQTAGLRVVSEDAALLGTITLIVAVPDREMGFDREEGAAT